MKRVSADDVRNWLKENRDYIELVEYAGSVSKRSKFRCTLCGYEWETSFHCLRFSFACPHCGSRVRLNEKEAKDWLKNHKPEIELVRYGGCVSKPSVFKCNECGNEWTTTFYTIKKGVYCPMCSETKKAVHKENLEQAIKEWLAEKAPNVELVEYSGSCGSKSKFRCTKCGNEWSLSFNAMTRRKGICVKCGDGKCVTREMADKWLEEHKPNIEILEYGGRATKKTLFHCKDCGHTWSTQLAVMKNANSGCPKCSAVKVGVKNRTTEEEARKWVKEHRPDIELVTYGGMALCKSSFRCKECGNEWLATLSSIKRGSGCRLCAYKARSYDEDRAKKWLEVHKPNVELVEFGGLLRTKSKFRCKLCGYEWEMLFTSMQVSKVNCRRCKCQVTKTIDSTSNTNKNALMCIEPKKVDGVPVIDTVVKPVIDTVVKEEVPVMETSVIDNDDDEYKVVEVDE